MKAAIKITAKMKALMNVELLFSSTLLNCPRYKREKTTLENPNTKKVLGVGLVLSKVSLEKDSGKPFKNHK